MAQSTKVQTLPPHYEGDEAEPSGDECVVSGDIVIVRRRGTPVWPGLENGAAVALNKPHDNDVRLFQHYGWMPQLTLAADASLKQIARKSEAIRRKSEANRFVD